MIFKAPILALFAAVAFSATAIARPPDLVDSKLMTLELALDIARQSVEACRAQGYQVSAVVVDRSGQPVIVLRDVYASHHTIQIARDKANAVVLSGVSSAEFRKSRADIRAEMNHVDGVLVLEGGLPIRAAGSLVGAVGVSGAPGGDKDEACARKALEAVRDRLEFVF